VVIVRERSKRQPVGSRPAGSAVDGLARRLGATLAVGLGLTAAPSAKPASILGFNHCCPSNCDLPGGGSCGAGTQKFYCTGSCPFCCICLSGSSCIDSSGHCIC
jgi:hypothetical protein